MYSENFDHVLGLGKNFFYWTGILLNVVTCGLAGLAKPRNVCVVEIFVIFHNGEQNFMFSNYY